MGVTEVIVWIPLNPELYLSSVDPTPMIWIASPILSLIVATVTCALLLPALSDNVLPFVYPEPPSTISTAVT